MIRPITESHWVGLTLAEAIDLAKAIDYTHRIVEEDGKSLMLDMSAKSNRVNLRLRNNIVIGVFTG